MATARTVSDKHRVIMVNGQQSVLVREAIQKLINSFPNPVMILAENRHIVHVNDNFLTQFCFSSAEDVLGKLPEEIFTCLYRLESLQNPTKDFLCQKCGHALIESNMEHRIPFSDQCSLAFIESEDTNRILHHLKSYSTSLSLDNQIFTFVSLDDITIEMRRHLMDKVFFHDILNKAGNIIGLVDLMDCDMQNKEKLNQLHEILRTTSLDLISEIKYQREYSLSQNDEYTIQFEPVKTSDLLIAVKNEMENNDVAVNKSIQIKTELANSYFVTDPLLLKRVLINMLKNALEAAHERSTVVLGCKFTEDGRVQFWVHNDESISEEIKNSLFHSSKSTKGCNRGLGLLSIRLVGERYLKGKVAFNSSQEQGTTFMINLPLAPQKRSH